MGVDRSEGLAGRLAEAKTVADRAGRALIKKESESMLSAFGFVRQTIHGPFFSRDESARLYIGRAYHLLTSRGYTTPHRATHSSRRG